jgi:hypothetical protein
LTKTTRGHDIPDSSNAESTIHGLYFRYIDEEIVEAPALEVYGDLIEEGKFQPSIIGTVYGGFVRGRVVLKPNELFYDDL